MLNLGSESRNRAPSWLIGRAEAMLNAAWLPTDDEDERTRKTVMMLMIIMALCAAVVWGGSYLLLGFPRAALVPVTLGLAALGGLFYFLRTKRYGLPLRVLLTLVLFLSFGLQWILGGFWVSGAVMIWAIVAPIAALIFLSGRRALAWFGLYFVLTIVSGVVDPLVAKHAVSMPHNVIIASFVMNFLGVSLVFCVAMYYFLQKLQRAKDDSESLLLNILPAPVALRLMEGEEIIADRYDEVTVLFADIVDFTPLAAELPAEQVVTMLNELFTAFDDLAERHGLEKIRTIGDAYMAIAGAPTPRPDHAQAVAEMALDMLDLVHTFKREPLKHVELRVGAHSGPILAGVIGRKKFGYDVYGDTVNTASRMESHGLPGRIQVSEQTFQRLSATYELETRGEVAVKGKGIMTTYWLTGRRSVAEEGEERDQDRSPEAVA